tara:strand:+ start:373 stop:501 length:129 start_codon:yes stop_codon:yes gene_type:complete
MKVPPPIVVVIENILRSILTGKKEYPYSAELDYMIPKEDFGQ